MRVRSSNSNAIACLILAMGVTVATAADSKTPDAKEVSLEGEILDLHCYLLMPESGYGPDHAQCAMRCINRGLPAGFLADGQVYVLLGPGHESPADMVVAYAGQTVHLTGTFVERNGVKAIQVKSVARARTSHTRKANGRDDQ